jgi:putative nucleotidyltransferase with HDIG domain
VHRDQAIASHLLRVANSATYVGLMPCASLQQAISRLGLRQVGEIAMATALRGHLFHDPACADLLAIVWKHSVLAGFFTKEIARQLRRNVEIAFLCGLLHDVGKAVLLSSVDESIGPGSPTPPMRDVLGAVEAHHVETGVLLAVEWKLPDQIEEAVRFHHTPAAAPRFAELAHTVALADALAHHVAPSVLSAEVTIDDVRQHRSLDALNVYPDQLDAMVMYYGQVLTDRGRLSSLDVPVLGFFGAEDASIPVRDVQAFRGTLMDLGKQAEVLIVPGVGHAFANPSGGTYNERAANEAWTATLGFLERNMKLAKPTQQ